MSDIGSLEGGRVLLRVSAVVTDWGFRGVPQPLTPKGPPPGSPVMAAEGPVNAAAGSATSRGVDISPVPGSPRARSRSRSGGRDGRSSTLGARDADGTTE